MKIDLNQTREFKYCNKHSLYNIKENKMSKKVFFFSSDKTKVIKQIKKKNTNPCSDNRKKRVLDEASVQTERNPKFKESDSFAFLSDLSNFVVVLVFTARALGLHAKSQLIAFRFRACFTNRSKVISTAEIVNYYYFTETQNKKTITTANRGIHSLPWTAGYRISFISKKKKKTQLSRMPTFLIKQTI